MEKMNRKKNTYPDKRKMNLYYKPDRTTVPATVALYVLFVLTLLLGFAKFFIYDVLQKLEETRQQLSRVQQEKSVYDGQLSGYEEVLRRYQLYAATEEERSQTDRMEVLALLDEVVRPKVDLSSVSISDGFVNIRFSGVTLRETAEIVRQLDESPIVLRTTVDTAATDSGREDRTAAADGTAEGGGSSAENIVTANVMMTLQRENEAENTAESGEAGESDETTSVGP